MPRPDIEEFGRLLVTEVRDVAIGQCDMLLKPNSSSASAKRWKKLATGGAREAMQQVAPEPIDRAIFALLTAIDGGRLRLSFTGSDGKTVDLTEEGLSELAGWWVGDDGWAARYTKKRHTSP